MADYSMDNFSFHSYFNNYLVYEISIQVSSLKWACAVSLANKQNKSLHHNLNRAFIVTTLCFTRSKEAPRVGELKTLQWTVVVQSENVWGVWFLSALVFVFKVLEWESLLDLGNLPGHRHPVHVQTVRPTPGMGVISLFFVISCVLQYMK